MVIFSGCSRKQLDQDAVQVDIGDQLKVEAQVTDEESDTKVQQKFTLERLSAENFYYEEAHREEPMEINAIPSADILCSADWGNGSFYICRVNKRVENEMDFYDIIAAYEENRIFIQLASLEEEICYPNIRLVKYENTLKYDGYKVMISVGVNAQDVFYFTREINLQYPVVVFKVSALDTYEFDLDTDGDNEIIAMQLGTSIYDEDSNGYFYYSTEKYMKENGLDFNNDKGYYFIKDQSNQIVNIYSLLRNSELLLDTDEMDEGNTVSELEQNTDNINQDNWKGNKATDNTEAKSEHLDFYDDFEMYNNSWDYFKGFVLSEEWIDGEPYYKLWNEEKDVKILVDKTQENAVIYHNGKSMDYKMDYMITGTTAHAAIDVMDITNDGNDDLIIYHGAGGTGVWEGNCEVFDLDTLQEYEIDDVVYKLESRITVEPIKIIEDGYLKCKITDDNGNTYYGKVGGAYENILVYSYTPSDFSSYYLIEVDYDQKCLAITTGIIIDPMLCNYLGNLHSYLKYNPKTERFELTDDLKVEISEQ
jgi:hypothetical protein